MAMLKRGQLYVNESTGKIYYYGFPSGGGGIAWHEAAGGSGTWDGSTVSSGTITTLASTTVNATTLNGTLGTAAQPNVTSLGTLTTLTVDNITVNGNDINTGSGTLNLQSSGTTELSLNGNDVTIATNNLKVEDGLSRLQRDITNDIVVRHRATNASFASSVTQIMTTRAGNSAFNLAVFDSNSATDREFKFRGDGEATADGSFSGGGADFAEYMEWQDGNPDNEDRTGMTVAIVPNDDGKVFIKIAEDGDTVAGVVSARPTVIGNNDWNKWHGKHRKDGYGRYILDDNGDRIVDSAYDENLEHETREARKEWSAIGLVGLIVIRDGQQTASNWIRIGQVENNLSRWLVR